ncbi:MAG: M60 family metallopeptidase, partial [Myxococcota bacterium]|nr:M60 family metallopeptidase [Myxococcota bacterium]
MSQGMTRALIIWMTIWTWGCSEGQTDPSNDSEATCETGYKSVDGTCVDIDECATGNGGCGDPDLWDCENQPGGDPVCVDVPECAVDNGGCGDPTYTGCDETEGGPPVCRDVDECETDNGGCGDATWWICANVKGAPPTCIDVNECTSDNGGCGDITLWDCENQAGGPPKCTFNPLTDWAWLTQDVETVVSGGSMPSSLVIHGDTAFPVVFDDGNRAVIAAARVDDGKALHVAHETHLGGALFAEGDSGQLLLNTVSWMTQGFDDPVIGVANGMSGATQFLGDAGYQTVTTNPLELAGVDVYVRQTYGEVTDDEVAGVQEFVRSGGGLITGGHAWYWSYNNENAPEQHPGNKMMWDFGFTLTAATAGAGTYTVDATPPTGLQHASQALVELTEHLSATSPLTLDQQSIAVDTVAHAVEMLPLTFTAYYDNVKTFIAVNPPILPSQDEPLIPADQPIEHLIAKIDNRLAQGLSPEDLTAHEAVPDFPGAVDDGVFRITTTVTVDASYEGRSNEYLYSGAGADVWRSTGLYAPAGDLVTVSVPAFAAGEGLSILIGSHTDTLWHKEEIRRFPQVTRTYLLETTETPVGNAFGGLLYVRVPADTDLGEIDVTFSSVVAAPLYIHGETSVDDWNTTSRNDPGPWAELVSDRFVLTIPSSLAATLDDPLAVMNLWDAVQDANADLENSPHERVRPERFVLDRQISAGWMHSGYPIMGPVTGADSLLDVETIEAEGSWGPFHELGHNHQWRDWLLPGTTEASCNLWSVYVSEEVFGIDRSVAHPALDPAAREERTASYLAGGADFWEEWSVWTALETYLQLQETFGWVLYQNLFPEYRKLSEGDSPQTDQERINQWVVRSSEQVGMNLGPFYQA